MRDNLHVPMTLADIASSVNLSQYHFSRVFHAATGEPPRRYLTRLRIDAARRQLSRGRSPVAEIARSCGFTTAGSFRAAFLRQTGLSPTAYRARFSRSATPIR